MSTMVMGLPWNIASKGGQSWGSEACDPSVEQPELQNTELEDEIERASEILELEADWDGEGSVAYSQNTFDRAAEFLRKQARAMLGEYGLNIPVPRIGPGP